MVMGPPQATFSSNIFPIAVFTMMTIYPALPPGYRAAIESASAPQPLCPGPGYFWTPGYWAWNDEGGYYWVPGTWVVAPIGMLWTPGYWGWGAGFYAWHPGYWGPHVGFYGGINYGYGYGGAGFYGGEWRGGVFFYNTAVIRVDTVHVTNVYTHTVVNNESHVAFNGGEGGVAAHATAEEESAAREPHQAALATQTQHEHAASQNRASFASENHGAPAVAATARPGEFSGHGAVAAKAGAEYHAPSMSPKEARAPAAASDRAFTPPSKNGGGSGAERESKDKTASEPKSTPHGDSHAESASKSKPAKQAKPPKHQKESRDEKREKGR